jgi:type IV pilus assembly protein PilB
VSQTRSTRPTLSSILVDGGVVTQEQVDAAFQRQLETGRLIGESLVELGYTSEENIGWGLSKQLGIPYVDIQTGAADLELVRKFPDALLRRLKAAPLFKSQDEVVIAMSDPSDPDAVEQLRAAAGSEVALVIGCPSSIRRVLDSVFGPERDSTASSSAVPRTAPSGSGEEEAETPAHRVVWERSGTSFLLYHVHAARSAQASEIHFVPAATGLSVSYRTDQGIEAKGIEHSDSAVYLRTRLAHLGAPDLDAACVSSWGHAVVDLGGDRTHLGVCHCRASAGITTVLRLLPDSKEAPDLSTLGMSPIGEAEIRDFVEGPEGLVIVHGPPRAGGTTVLASLAALASRDERRTVVFEPWPVAPYAAGTTRIPFGAGDPGTLDWARIAVGLGSDVVVLDDVLRGESIREVLSGSTVGRLVFARTDWLDARRLLAFLAGTSNGRAVLRDRPFAMVMLPAARREGSGVWTSPADSDAQAGLLQATVLTEEERDALLKGGRS